MNRLPRCGARQFSIGQRVTFTAASPFHQQGLRTGTVVTFKPVADFIPSKPVQFGDTDAYAAELAHAGLISGARVPVVRVDPVPQFPYPGAEFAIPGSQLRPLEADVEAHN
jgi:hypothetical protein